MEPLLQAAHFQLSARCNLACTFCGQSRGALAVRSVELSEVQWLSVASSIRQDCARHGLVPQFTLWGGEPLFVEHFDSLSRALAEQGDRLQTVTNGTMIDRHAEVLNRCYEVIHVSFDGCGASDDQIRGQGTFARVTANLPLLKERRGKLVFLLTVADHNVAELPEIVHCLEAFAPDEIVLQPLIWFSPEEIKHCARVFAERLDCPDPGLAAYCREDGGTFEGKWREAQKKIGNMTFQVPVRITPHGQGDGTACGSLYRRVHIRCDGEVGFCTDFFGFSLGNVKAHTVPELFYGERASRYRKTAEAGLLDCCSHCAWHLQK